MQDPNDNEISSLFFPAQFPEIDDDIKIDHDGSLNDSFIAPIADITSVMPEGGEMGNISFSLPEQKPASLQIDIEYVFEEYHKLEQTFIALMDYYKRIFPERFYNTMTIYRKAMQEFEAEKETVATLTLKSNILKQMVLRYRLEALKYLDATAISIINTIIDPGNAIESDIRTPLNPDDFVDY